LVPFFLGVARMQCNTIREELPAMIRVFLDSASVPSRLLAGTKLRKGVVAVLSGNPEERAEFCFMSCY